MFAKDRVTCCVKNKIVMSSFTCELFELHKLKILEMTLKITMIQQQLLYHPIQQINGSLTVWKLNWEIYSFSDTILVTVFPFTISVNGDFTIDDDLMIL